MKNITVVPSKIANRDIIDVLTIIQDHIFEEDD